MDRVLWTLFAATAVLSVSATLRFQGQIGSDAELLPPDSSPISDSDGFASDGTTPDDATDGTIRYTAHGRTSELPVQVGTLLFATGLASVPFTLASLRWVLLVPLFSRLNREDLLENRVRARILELIKEQPGLGITDVCARLEIGWGTAVHHLSRLETAGLVASRDSGRHRRFFLSNTSPTVRTALCVLTTDLNRRLLEHVRANPGTTQTEACRALGISASLLHKYAGRLKAEGLIEARRQWRTVQYYAAETAASHLAEFARLQPQEASKGLAAPMGDA